ncbi:MAG: hypothetical protein PHC61_14075 [Chitinivibrionales bacterium]|nr:hypothetical protein [Chitinivibrionales bacterium]
MKSRLQKRSARALCLLFLFVAQGRARSLTFEYAFLEDKLKTASANQVEFKQVSDTPIVYRAWGVWNFNHSASKVAAVALDFPAYPRIFRYVYRCDRITKPPRRVCPLGTWYVEGRAAFARVWAIGNIDSLYWPDSAHLRFIAGQNEDRWLEASWHSQERPGWFSYRTYGLRMAAFVVAAGNDSCRLGIVAQGWVKQAMPQWLVRMGTSIILPHLLQDLEKEVARREKLLQAPQPPWYDKWYLNIRNFFL